LIVDQMISMDKFLHPVCK